jgi:predicted dehydrogenase
MIGVAFLGSGFARNVQAPCFEMLEGVKLVGASSPNRAETFAREFNMPVHTPNWKELVKRDDVQLVVVSSPPKLHCEQTLYALEHGKHVLCEKPFAMNVAEARQMADAAKKSGLLAIIDHELRMSPARKYMHYLIRDGQIGAVYYATANSHYTSRRDESKPYSWWFDKNWGGGAWGAIGSHMIDQLRYFAGEITEAHTLTATSIKERKDKAGHIHTVSSDDVSAAVVRFEEGGVGQVGSYFVSAENKVDIEVVGQKGSLKIDMNDNLYWAEGNQSYIKLEIPLTDREQELAGLYKKARITARSMYAFGFMHMADALAHAIANGDTHIEGAATFDDGVKIQQVLDTAQDAFGGLYK